MVEKLSLDNAVEELHAGSDEAGEPEVELIDPVEEGADAEIEEPEGEEPEGQEDDPYAQLVPVKIDGRETQVTLREALDGYIRTATFHQRMSEADVVRRQAEQVAGELTWHRKHYLDSIEVVKQLIAQEGLDDPRREDYEDGASWLEAKAVVDARKAKIQQLSAVQADEVRQVQGEALERLQAKATFETRVFYEHPEMRGQWRDLSSFKAHMDKTKAWAQQRLGYSKQELASIYDHRAAIALTKARLYDEAMERANARVGRKAAGAERYTIKGNVTAGAQRGPLNGVKRAEATFNKRPTVDNAVDLILSKREVRH